MQAHMKSKAIPDNSTVLIVGAASFIGAHIVLAFLKAPRNRLRRLHLLLADNLTPFLLYASTLTLSTVPDITAPGAFDAVLKDVSSVIYIASALVLRSRRTSQASRIV